MAKARTKVEELEILVRWHKRRGDRGQRDSRLVNIDSLTGIMNRKGFDQMLEKRLRRTRDIKRRRLEDGLIGFIYLDLDNFKPVNDNFGHAAGDAVLCAVANRLQGHLRDTDYIARWGGDEFGLIVEVSNLAELRELANRVYRLISSLSVPFKGATLNVTASVGVTHVLSSDTMKSAFGRADAALYCAKQQKGLPMRLFAYVAP